MDSEAVLTIMVEILGDFIANSLPASTFLGLLWVILLSWSERSQVLIQLGLRGYEPLDPWQSVGMNDCCLHIYQPVP